MPMKVAACPSMSEMYSGASSSVISCTGCISGIVGFQMFIPAIRLVFRGVDGVIPSPRPANKRADAGDAFSGVSGRSVRGCSSGDTAKAETIEAAVSAMVAKIRATSCIFFVYTVD